MQSSREVVRALAALIAASRSGRRARDGSGTCDDEAPRALVDTLARVQLAGLAAPDAAHEIGNHLQVVLGNAELVAEAGELSKAARIALTRIVEAAERAASLNLRLHALARGIEERRDAAPISGPATFGTLVDANLPRLAWVAGPAARLDTTLTAAARALPMPDHARRRTVIDILHCLLIGARERHRSAARLSLHADLDGMPTACGDFPSRGKGDLGAPSRVARTILRLRVGVDEGAGAAGDDGSPPGPESMLTCVLLALLVERFDGAFDAHDGADSQCVALAMEPALAKP